MIYLVPLFEIAIIHLLIVMTPGPAFVTVLRCAARQQRSQMALLAIGLAVAPFCWALAALLGLEFVMSRVSGLFQILEVAGGCYLFYLGVQGWRRVQVNLIDPSHGAIVKRKSSSHLFRLGLATNFSNPKVIIFFGSIFTALLNPSMPLWVRAAALVVVPVNEFGWYFLVALVFTSERMQHFYRESERTIERLAGSVMMLFGLRLLWSARK